MIATCMCDSNYKLMILMSFDLLQTHASSINHSIHHRIWPMSIGAGQAQLIKQITVHIRSNISFSHGFLLLESRYRVERKRSWDKQYKLVARFQNLRVLDEWHLHLRLL